MKRFIQGVHRGQSTLLPESLDDYVADTNPVRVVDVFVDATSLLDEKIKGAGCIGNPGAKHGALPADPEVSCKGVEPCVRAGININILTYMNIENSLPITALETPGGSPMKNSSDTHPNHLPDSSYGLFIDNQ